jgi:hypothetical protein
VKKKFFYKNKEENMIFWNSYKETSGILSRITA